MKKLNLKNLKLGVDDILQRNQLKSVLGGQSDGCRIAVRNADGSFGYWSDNIYSYEEASSAYHNSLEYNDGSYASGYCCSSC
ncbi:MAG TPA: hypothetical protein VLZ83_08285 [Edaphocola sp.]|nr:hypothetical protein [Edaphocola sp.]